MFFTFTYNNTYAFFLEKIFPTRNANNITAYIFPSYFYSSPWMKLLPRFYFSSATRCAISFTKTRIRRHVCMMYKVNIGVCKRPDCIEVKSVGSQTQMTICETVIPADSREYSDTKLRKSVSNSLLFTQFRILARNIWQLNSYSNIRTLAHKSCFFQHREVSRLIWTSEWATHFCSLRSSVATIPQSRADLSLRRKQSDDSTRWSRCLICAWTTWTFCYRIWRID